MKKAITIALIGISSMVWISCGNSTESNTHTHEDGSTHTDHDTIKPVQENFVVPDSAATDTLSKPHTHQDGEQHSH